LGAGTKFGAAKGYPSQCAGGQLPRSPVSGRWLIIGLGFPSSAAQLYDRREERITLDGVVKNNIKG
jgi:hypothetical protein